MSQKDRVLVDLRAAGEDGVCSSHWYRTFIPNARNRIGELADEGHIIESQPCKDKHEAAFYRYWLVVNDEVPLAQAELELVK